MGVIGPLARSAADLELALDVISSEPAPAARGRTLAELRIAVLPWQDWLPVDEDIAAALEDLAARLPHARTAAPPGFDLWAHEELYAALLSAIVLADLDDEGRDGAEATLRSAADAIAPAALRGLRASRQGFQEMLAERAVWQERWAAFFRDHDLLLTPVTIVNAFPHTRGGFWSRRVQVAGREEPYKRLEVYPGLSALSGCPATAFPTGRLSRERLPIGLQVMGPAMEDRTSLQFAVLAERELGCEFKAPPSYG
jgi:amidase